MERRHAALKQRCPKGCEGASPSTGTVWYALSAPDGTFVWGESNREGVDPLSPTAEATDLESVQCAFKSHRGYPGPLAMNRRGNEVGVS